MKTTRYFEEQVLRKRPYIRREWCAQVLAAPVRREIKGMAGFDSGAEYSSRARLDRASSEL